MTGRSSLSQRILRAWRGDDGGLGRGGVVEQDVLVCGEAVVGDLYWLARLVVESP
jgi:hypothetical protein